MSNAIAEFRIVDHGVDHEQFFQGHSTVFTDYTDSATGCGASAREAAQDAAEQLACAGFDLPAALFVDIDALSADVDVPEFDDDAEQSFGAMSEPSCAWHYVSIDVRRFVID